VLTPGGIGGMVVAEAENPRHQGGRSAQPRAPVLGSRGDQGQLEQLTDDTEGEITFPGARVRSQDQRAGVCGGSGGPAEQRRLAGPRRAFDHGEVRRMAIAAGGGDQGQARAAVPGDVPAGSGRICRVLRVHDATFSGGDGGNHEQFTHLAPHTWPTHMSASLSGGSARAVRAMGVKNPEA